MFLGLSVNTVVCCTEQNSGICLGGTGDHVLDEISVTRSIDDGPVKVRSKEFLVSDVDGNSTLSLFLESVHNVCKSETGLTSFCSEFFVLFDNVAFNVTRVEEETSNGCGLSVVDVTNKYDVTVWLASVFPL